MHDCVRRTILATLPTLTLGLTACTTQASLQQRFVGPLRGCGAGQAATLTRIGADFAFAPDNGALLIRGRVARDGSLAGQFNTQPAGKPPYVLAVSGRIADGTATLRYVTPHCTAEGRLHLVPARLLP